MFCQNCGNQLAEGANFCPKCGHASNTAVPPPARPPAYIPPKPSPDLLKRPGVITLLAVLQFIAGALFVIGGITVFVLISKEQDPMVGQIVSLIFAVVGTLHLFCGYGLWTLKPYGRAMQFVFAGIGILGFPIGTIISILIFIYLSKPHVKILFSGRTVEKLNSTEIQILSQPPQSANAVVVAAVAVGLAFFLIAFIGIVAAIAIPNLLNAIQRAKEKRTMADIRSIAVALEAYAVDNNSYPKPESISELRSLLQPKYIHSMAVNDAWEHQLIYTPFEPDDQGRYQRYIIISAGKDGVLEHESYSDYLPQSEGTVIQTTNFNNDIVFSSGSFIEFPETTVSPH